MYIVKLMKQLQLYAHDFLRSTCIKSVSIYLQLFYQLTNKT